MFDLRIVFKLPSSEQKFFLVYVQNFNSHSDEADPERIKQIIERAAEDAKWVLNKVRRDSRGRIACKFQSEFLLQSKSLFITGKIRRPLDPLERTPQLLFAALFVIIFGRASVT